MRFELDPDQEALAKSARRFLDQHAQGRPMRAAMESEQGHDEALWRGMTEEMGWGAVTIPAAYDGFELGRVALMCMMEAMGRRLVCSPYFATIGLATTAILEAGGEAQKRAHLPAIAAGRETATLAWQAQGGGPESLGVVAERAGAGWRLQGEAHYVVDAGTAALVVVLAKGPDGPVLATVDAARAGVTRQAVPGMDWTRRLGTVGFDGVALDAASAQPMAPGALGRVFDRVRVTLCAEMLGGAERCLEMAVAYARERVQFGRAIGSFQAIKHKCADMLVLVESARSAVSAASWAAEHAPDELARAATVAKAYVSDAYYQCAAENIQIHGGIGFTWEHDAHLFFKRARASAAFLGGADFHYGRAAGMVL